jgi:NADH:ubiquinone oxidoreductase subunit 5 (subunit L)/multisubunit Na+/H+ antiporter MnhA subunit
MKNMTKKESLATRVIGIFLILTGIFLLGIWIYNLNFYYQFGKERIVDFENQFSIVKMFINYHYPFILNFTAIIAGIMLIREKKTGYMLAILTSALIGVFHLKAIFQNEINNELLVETSRTGIDFLYIGLTLLIPIIFFLITRFLLKKSNRKHFQLSRTNQIYLTIGLIFGLIEQIFIATNP